MNDFVLAKILNTMHRCCRNRTLSLTFYETGNKVMPRRPSTRVEYDQNLPDIYYVATVSEGSKTLSLMRKEPGLDRTLDKPITQAHSFDFNDLIMPSTVDYTVHMYCELSPFAKEDKQHRHTGVYKRYEECLKSDATLFVSLFKLIGDTVSVTYRSKDKLYLGHYIGNRLIMVDNTDWSMTVKVTDLYAVGQYLPGAELVDFLAYPTDLTISKYLRTLQNICAEKGIQYLEN